MKEGLGVKYYIRYTDDFVIVHQNPIKLASLLPSISSFLQNDLGLELHPNKVIIRKLRQGIDFLGYVTLPHYRVLRTKTERRMMKRVNAGNVASYLGLIKHCRGYRTRQAVQQKQLTGFL